jgi:hypothetical protein
MPSPYDPTQPTLQKSEVEKANEQTKSCSAAARYLRVSYNTYKKYAKMYGLFEEQKNPEGHGISNPYNVNTGKYSLKDIINGEHPNYDTGKLKQRLLRAGWKEQKCEVCGCDRRRNSDNTVPLVLQHKNGDDRDHRWENLEVVCLNCSYIKYGDVPRKKSQVGGY